MYTRTSKLWISLAACLIGLLGLARAADWPMYMRDNVRSGVTTETLSLGTLAQQWVYSAPAAPVLAWPLPQTTGPEFPKLKFDDAFYTASVGDLVYFGSSVDNKIYALDVDDGSIVWSFYTGGAVRNAPTVSGGYLYAGSDDGYVYCLNATTGALVWSYSTMATQQYLLGNGRLVSKRPCRTGVMLSGSTVYFGYGTFYEQGIGLTARNATTGAEVWLNANAGSSAVFTPQGYPILTDSRIIAPSGRYRPALFNSSTGAFVATSPAPDGSPKGSASGVNLALTADGANYFVGTNNILRAFSATTGERAAAADWNPARQLIATATRSYVLTGKNTPTATTQSRVKAFDANRTQLWQYPASGELNLCSIILAGDHVIAGASGMVYALNVSDGSLAWSASVNGSALGLAVANGKLYVSTDTGKVYCFGTGTPVNPTSPSFVEPFPDDDDFEDAAAAIVTQAGFTSTSNGYCLVMGTGTAAAIMGYNIAKRTNLRVHCVVDNANDAQQMRQALDGALMYGTRIVVDHVSSATLPYPDYFANLTVFVSEEGQTNPSGSELLRVTKPYGGWLMYGPVTGYAAPAPSQETLTLWDAAGDFTVTASNGFVQGAGPWYLLERGVLAGAGSWTHQNADAGNTGSSDDQWVRTPLALLWYGEPGAGEAPERHLRNVAPLSHNGRVFYQAFTKETGRTYIVCYDPFNGTRYWEADITDAYRVNTSANSGNLACNDDYLFVAAGNQCKRLDVVTGSVTGTYALPPGSSGQWGYIALDGGRLIGSVTTEADIARSHTLFARDIATGDLEWTYSEGEFRNNTVSISEGRVLFIEQRAEQLGGMSQSELLRAQRLGLVSMETLLVDPIMRTVVALNSATGAVAWERELDITNTGGMTLAKNGVLVLGVVSSPYGGKTDPSRRMVGLSVDDGRTLWDIVVGNTSRLLVLGNSLIAQPKAYNLSSGIQIPSWNMGRMSACGAISGSASLLFFREAYTKWYNIFTAGRTTYYLLRPGCWINTVPASGVVVQPEAGSECMCYYALQAALAFKSTNAGPNQAPTVSLTAPEEDALFIGEIPMAAEAEDSDGSIGRVEFYANGRYIGEDATSPYSFTWTSPTPGAHALTARAYDNQGGCTTSAAVNVWRNHPPEVTITAPAGGNVNGVINITATATDADGTVTRVEFYANDQYLGEDTSSPYSFAWASAPYGPHTLTARAIDNDGGAGTSAPVEITQTNHEPTVSITAPTPYQRFVDAPANINITANASDTDGSVTKVEFYEGANKLGEDTSSPYSFNWTNVPIGSYLLTARAIDNLNVYTVSAEVCVNVGPNNLPTVSITAPVGGAAFINNGPVITATASDADGFIARVEFYDGGAKLGESTTSPYTFDWTGGPLGFHTLTAKAIDNEDGVTTSDAVSISVWNAQDIGSPGTAGSTTYNSDTGVYTLKAAGAGMAGTADACHYAYQRISGDCTITARVVSDNSVYSTARVGVMVRESLDPGSKEFASLYMRYTPRVYRHYRTTTDGATSSSNVNVGALPYWVRLVRSGNSFTCYRSANGETWTAVGASPISIPMSDPVYIGLTANSGQTTLRTFTIDNVTITSSNLPPDVGLTAPTSGTRYVSTPANISITASAADADGTIAKVEFFEGENKLDEDTTSPYSYEWVCYTEDAYTLTVKATDNLGAFTISNPVLVRVGPNQMPSVSITDPTPDAVFNGDVTITATAADTDGTISKVEFYAGANKLGEVTASPYSYLWINPPAGTYTLTAKAIDNEDGYTVSDGVSVRVNAAPTVSLTAPENGQLYRDVPADISLAAEAADPDGAIVKVEFYRGQTKIGEDSTSPYSFEWTGVGEGEYTLTAKAIDNDDRATTSTPIAITVVDNPIIPPTVSITSPQQDAQFVAPADITITAEASDPSGMVVTVEFYQGETLLGEGAEDPENPGFYSFEWTGVPVGNYALTAKAIDDDEAFAISDVVNISVVFTYNELPTVSITSPADGLVMIGNSLTITADADDTDGTITKVEFFDGQVKIGETTSSPYSYQWTSVPLGVRTLTAKAFDNDGGIVVSSAVTITVWHTKDIGNVGVAGSASYSDGVFTVAGAGANGLYTNSNDAFFMVYQQMSGNSTVTVRLNNVTGTLSNNTARAGVIIRESLAPGSKTAGSLIRTYNNRVHFHRRTTTDAAGTDSYATVTAPIVPYWLKIVRSGNTLSAHRAPDVSGEPGTWTQTGSATVSMSSTVYVGFAVCSGTTASTNTATFSNLSLTGTVLSAPAVAITSPADGARFNIVPANITITASATDADGTITRVEFYEGETKLGEDSTSPYSFLWEDVGEGEYTLTAKAIDNGNQVSVSTPIAITVVDDPEIPPTVTLTAPTDGAIIVGNSYTLTAEASDTDGAITKVEFYQGQTKIGEVSTSPYSFNWTPIDAGVYSVTARAIDDDQLSADSDAAVFTVWNNQDIGTPQTAGSASYDSGTDVFTVTGGGVGFTGTADAFHYAYLPVSGDCTVTARILTCNGNGSHPAAQGGLAIRESLDAGSKEMAITYRNNLYVRYTSYWRTTTDGTVGSNYVTAGALPTWLRITRSGNTLTTYYSTNGTDWTQHRTATVTMNSTVYVGLAMTEQRGQVGTRTITADNVTITQQ